MAGSNWQQLAGGSVNPYDVLRDDGTPTADYGQHVICDGGTVTLPSPKANGAVLVSNISQDTTVTASTGLVEQESDVTHPSDVSDPALFVSNGADWYVANNLNYVRTIPDSEDLYARYDFSQASGTTSVSDQTGNGFDLSGDYTGPTATINGVQAGEFDGTDDRLSVDFSALSQPNTIFIVYKFLSVTDGEFGHVYDSNNLNNRHALAEENGSPSQTQIFAGTSQPYKDADTNPHIASHLFNETNSEVREDGTSELSNVDVGSETLDGFSVGGRPDDAQFANVAVGEILIYPQDKSVIYSDVEAYLSDKWGVAV